jgi:hypothetical protein
VEETGEHRENAMPLHRKLKRLAIKRWELRICIYIEYCIMQYKRVYHKVRTTGENYILHLGSNLRWKGGVFLAFHLKTVEIWQASAVRVTSISITLEWQY